MQSLLTQHFFSLCLESLSRLLKLSLHSDDSDRSCEPPPSLAHLYFFFFLQPASSASFCSLKVRPSALAIAPQLGARKTGALTHKTQENQNKLKKERNAGRPGARRQRVSCSIPLARRCAVWSWGGVTVGYSRARELAPSASVSHTETTGGRTSAAPTVV